MSGNKTEEKLSVGSFQTKLHRERLIAKRGTKEYKEIASKRAGAEGIPLVLRFVHNHLLEVFCFQSTYKEISAA